jgi:hypothetical protein
VRRCSGKLPLLVGVALVGLLFAVFCTACSQRSFAEVGTSASVRRISATGPPETVGLPSGQADERRFVPDEVILIFSANASPQAIRRVTRRYDLIQLESESLPSIGITLSRWQIGGHRSVPSVVGALQNQRIVASAQPNYLFGLEKSAGRGADTTRARQVAK